MWVNVCECGCFPRPPSGWQSGCAGTWGAVMKESAGRLLRGKAVCSNESGKLIISLIALVFKSKTTKFVKRDFSITGWGKSTRAQLKAACHYTATA